MTVSISKGLRRALPQPRDLAIVSATNCPNKVTMLFGAPVIVDEIVIVVAQSRRGAALGAVTPK
jgi:hypothetical protein